MSSRTLSLAMWLGTMLQPLIGASMLMTHTGVQTQRAQTTALDAISKSVNAARSNRKHEKLPGCDQDPAKQAALCLVLSCKLCEKYSHKGDLLDRYACPQPMGMEGNMHMPPRVIFEVDNDTGYIPMCKVNFAMKGWSCNSILAKTSIPKIRTKSTVRCAFNSYELVPSSKTYLLRDQIQVNSAHALNAYRFDIDSSKQLKYNTLLTQPIVPLELDIMLFDPDQLASSIEQGAPHGDVAVQVIPYSAGAVPAIFPDLSALGTAGASSFSPHIGFEQLEHQQQFMTVADHNKAHFESGVAAQTALAQTNAARAAALNAANEKAIAEQQAANAASSMAFAANKLAQTKASIEPIHQAMFHATAAQAAAEQRLAAANAAMARTQVQSLGISGLTAPAVVNGLRMPVHAAPATIHVVGMPATSMSSTSSMMSHQSHHSHGGVVGGGHQAGSVSAGGAVNEKEEKPTGGFFTSGVARYVVLIIVFVILVLGYYFLG